MAAAYDTAFGSPENVCPKWLGYSLVLYTLGRKKLQRHKLVHKRYTLIQSQKVGHFKAGDVEGCGGP